MMIEEESLATLSVGDSSFYGFVKASLKSKEDAIEFQSQLKTKYKDAAHVPLCWYDGSSSNGNNNGRKEKENDKEEERCYFVDEDGEPPNSVGPSLKNAIKKIVSSSTTSSSASKSSSLSSSPLCVVIVRYFGEQLLGVTCGRLSQCYERVTTLALHRRIHGPYEPTFQKLYDVHENLYGLASGDSELIFNVVREDENGNSIAEKIKQELNFDGFKGALNETLPRLQNLQATFSSTKDVMPIYRYPGNYHGTEWETHEWSPQSLKIKQAVEDALKPLIVQEMNHCVTNLYRTSHDFIDHHSDKDLDLNRNGVIVSVSLGSDERVMELRSRKHPQDIVRIVLPQRSMFVMGPKTNQEYTHSILISKKEDVESNYRISLTMRDVRTFLDLKTGFLFGQGTYYKSKEQVRRVHRRNNIIGLLGSFSICMSMMSFLPSQSNSAAASNRRLEDGSKQLSGTSAVANLAASGLVAFVANSILQFGLKLYRKANNEKLARQFFSKKSVSGTKY